MIGFALWKDLHLRVSVGLLGSIDPPTKMKKQNPIIRLQELKVKKARENHQGITNVNP